MQTAGEIEGYLKELRGKSKKARPFGFALIVAASDGEPAIYFAKKLAGARNAAKAELKESKKKKLILGLAYIEDGEMRLAKANKPLPQPIINKAFKKLFRKVSKYKSLFKSVQFIADEEYSAIAEKVENKDETESNLTEKIEMVAGLLDDLTGYYQDTNADINAQMKLLAGNDIPVPLENLRSFLGTDTEPAIKEYGKKLKAVQKKQGKGEAEEWLKTLLKELKKDIAATHKKLEAEVKKGFQSMGITDPESLVVGSSEWLLAQIELWINKVKSAVSEGIEKSKLKPLKKKLDKAKALVNVSGDDVVSAKSEEQASTMLDEVIKEFSKLQLDATLANLGGNLAEQAIVIWKKALTEALSEIKRFQNQVFSHSMVINDPRFALIRPHLQGLEAPLVKESPFLVMLNSRIGSPPSSKELTRMVKAHKKDLNPDLEVYKKIDASTNFGSVAIASTLRNALKKIASLK